MTVDAETRHCALAVTCGSDGRFLGRGLGEQSSTRTRGGETELRGETGCGGCVSIMTPEAYILRIASKRYRAATGILSVSPCICSRSCSSSSRRLWNCADDIDSPASFRFFRSRHCRQMDSYRSSRRSHRSGVPAPETPCARQTRIPVRTICRTGFILAKLRK